MPTNTATSTPTQTPTFTPTPTPTCAPTGTPYCSDACVPCPTVRPDCYISPCGLCVQNPLTCDPGLARYCSDDFASIRGCCHCVTPTSTPTETPTGPTPTVTLTPTSTWTATPTTTGTPAAGVFAYVTDQTEPRFT